MKCVVSDALVWSQNKPKKNSHDTAADSVRKMWPLQFIPRIILFPFIVMLDLGLPGFCSHRGYCLCYSSDFTVFTYFLFCFISNIITASRSGKTESYESNNGAFKHSLVTNVLTGANLCFHIRTLIFQFQASCIVEQYINQTCFCMWWEALGAMMYVPLVLLRLLLLLVFLPERWLLQIE